MSCGEWERLCARGNDSFGPISVGSARDMAALRKVDGRSVSREKIVLWRKVSLAYH